MFPETMKKILMSPWYNAIFPVISGVLLLLMGFYIGKNGLDILAILFIVIYFVIFTTLNMWGKYSVEEIGKQARQSSEAVYDQKYEELKETYNNELKNEQEKTNEFQIKYNRSNASLDFLLDRFRRTIAIFWGIVYSAIRELSNGDISREQIATLIKNLKPLQYKEILETTLKDMCLNLRNCALLRNITEEPEFRATYMEVVNNNGQEVLEYCSWYTLDGSVPRSKSLNITYAIGDGIAGKAWKDQRPFIITEFDPDKTDWKENYTGQGKLYKSMVCVPVFHYTREDGNKVIGVITIDSNVQDFFGAQTNRTDEEKFSRIVRPYANYISFMYSLKKIETNLIAHIHT